MCCKKCRILDVVSVVILLASCNKGSGDCPYVNNPAVYIEDPSKLEMLNSIRQMDEVGRFYYMNYTADYCLDKMIDADCGYFVDMLQFAAVTLMDKPIFLPETEFSAGCSIFAVPEAGTDCFLMGRNYDYCHRWRGVEDEVSPMIVYTEPTGWKKSFSFIDPCYLNCNKGFLNDGKTDISFLVCAPYIVEDGMNEDGFAIGGLALDGKGTSQDDPSKKSLWITPMMRMLLDRASTVRDAVEMLKSYNVCMPPINFHFFIADATGDFATIEYVFPEWADRNISLPNVLAVQTGCDTFRYATNFYIDSSLEDYEHGGKSSHGRDRYNIMRKDLKDAGYMLSREDAMKLLETVSQKRRPDTLASHTWWSAVYNLTEKKISVAIDRDYEKVWTFTF